MQELGGPLRGMGGVPLAGTLPSGGALSLTLFRRGEESRPSEARARGRRGPIHRAQGWGPRAGRSPALSSLRSSGRLAGVTTRCQGESAGTLRPLSGLLALTLAILLTLLGTRNRVKKVREHQLPIGPLTIFRATLRGNLAYTYHQCRHLTRYYTLPLLLSGILFPPLLMLTAILCSIVISV